MGSRLTSHQASAQRHDGTPKLEANERNTRGRFDSGGIIPSGDGPSGLASGPCEHPESDENAADDELLLLNLLEAV